MKKLLKAIFDYLFYILQASGIIETTFEIKSSQILMITQLNYILGRKILFLKEGEIIDKNRLEFSIQRFIEKNVNFRIYYINFIFSEETNILKMITIPEIPSQKIHNAVVMHIENMGIFDINSINFGYKVTGKIKERGKTYLKVLISIAKANIVKEYTTIFSNLGIKIKSLIPSGLPTLGILEELKTHNALGLVITKENNLLVAIIQNSSIVQLEMFESTQEELVIRYLINTFSEFIKNKNVFLEKIFFIHTKYEIIENVFETINIICLAGEDLIKKNISNLITSGNMDILGYFSNPKLSMKIKLEKEIIEPMVDKLLSIGVISSLLLLLIMTIIFLLNLNDMKYREFSLERVSTKSEFMDFYQKYKEIIEVKNTIKQYKQYIESFKRTEKRKHEKIIFDISSRLDPRTWLESLEIYPKNILINGYSLDSKSFLQTVEKLSEITYINNISIISNRSQNIKNRQVIKFTLEMEVNL